MDSASRKNFRHLYADIFWFGVLAGSTLAFLAVYASRVGASSLQVGLLTAGPAAMNLLVSIPAGRWMAGRSLVRVSFISALAHRFWYFVLILVPLFFGERIQVWILIVLFMLISIPATSFAIAFNSLFAGLVPIEWRGEVFGKRNALAAISLTLTSLLCGIVLDFDRLAFPHNYQVVFAIGAVGALLSSYHIGRLRVIGEAPGERPELTSPAPAQDGKTQGRNLLRRFFSVLGQKISQSRSSLRLDVLRSSFGTLMLSFLGFYTFQYLAIPLFPIFFVRNLHLSDGAISLGTALFYVLMLLISLRLNWIMERLGNRRLLIISSLAMGFYPLLIGLARDARLYWAASLVGGGIWALANAGLLGRLMERSPEGDRPAHMAVHNLVLNFGILAGSFLGPLLGDLLDLRSALLISAILRMSVGFLFWKWG